MTFVLTGLDQERQGGVDRRCAGDGDGRRRPAARRRDHDGDPVRAGAAATAPTRSARSGLLHVFVKAPDERAVGRAFSSAAVELALASYPGFFTTTPPGPALVVRRVLAGARPGRRDRPGRRARRRHAGSASTRPPTGPPSAEPIVAADRSTPRRPASSRARRSARTSAPAPATRAATPTSASGPATTPATPGSRPTSPPTGPPADPRGRRPRACTATSSPTCAALNFVLVGYLGEGVASARPPSTPRPRASASTSAPARVA